MHHTRTTCSFPSLDLRHRRRHAARRGQRGPPDEPRQAVLAGARITKGNLIQYYADVAPLLLPHMRDRAMVMKRYPHGAAGEFFFMKRAPSPRPDWIQTCRIPHDSGNVIDFPVIHDLPSLLWVINLGCIDLNQWYAKCDDVDRPDYVHFDLDPVGRRRGSRCSRPALIVRDALESLEMPCTRRRPARGAARLRADRARARSERRLDVRQGARAGAGERGIPS